MSCLDLGVVGNCAITSMIDRKGRPVRLVDFAPCFSRFALASVGRREEALELFNNLLARLNRLSEDLDPRTGELWGNFPQTCSQAGLTLSVMRLWRSWKEEPWHAS